MTRHKTHPLFNFKAAIAVIFILLSLAAPPAVYAEEVQPDAQADKPLNSWDEWALSELAWQHYKGGFYKEALKEFSRLVRQNPGNGDYHLGMAYTLLKLERLDEALKIAEEHEAEKKDFSTIKAAIYQKKGNEAYDKKEYAEALEYFKKAISAKPSDAGTQAMYGWSLYNQGRLDEALPRLVEMYKNDNDHGIAEIIILIYQRNNDTSNASLFAASLAESKDKNLNKVAADYYFSQGYPVKASLTYKHPKTCYFNANNPELDMSASVRYKTGQKGTSRLREESLTATYILPLAPANEMSFSVAAKELSSGAAPDGVFAGSHYKSIPLKNNIPQSVQVIEPRLSYKGADKIPYRLEAGTTPIGAHIEYLTKTIDPLPVFNADVTFGSLRLNAHQESVKESMLSYVGLKDPYGDSYWGRVARSGVEAEYKLRPYDDYWLSLKAGYDYYWGEFVLQNSSLSVTAAVGRTFHPASNAFSAGLFATGKQFKNNSNFYTYGHGGYFSPARFMAAGPMIRFETAQCKDYYVDIQAAVSYLKYTTENVKQYPFETSGPQSGYHFNGERFTGLGYSVDGRAVRLITGYWAVETSFKLNKSADYREWTALASINYYFEPRNAVVTRR